MKHDQVAQKGGSVEGVHTVDASVEDEHRTLNPADAGSSPALVPRERPILFSAPMVRAILDGKKTQTRRIVKCPRGICADCFARAVPHHGEQCVFGGGPYLRVPACDHNDIGGDRVRSPYGVAGDRLWVRETFGYDTAGKVWYRASCEPGNAPPQGWSPSIFMRRKQSRITLDIVSVRVERLHAIADSDALAEGVTISEWSTNYEGKARGEFERLWDSINGERAAWASNPWVWVVEFRRCAS